MAQGDKGLCTTAVELCARPSAGRSCPSDGVSASDCIWPGSSSTPSRHQCPAGWGQKLVREVPRVPTANPATKAGICRSGAGETGLQHATLRSSSSHGQSWSLPPVPISISLSLAGSDHHSWVSKRQQPKSFCCYRPKWPGSVWHSESMAEQGLEHWSPKGTASALVNASLALSSHFAIWSPSG